MSKYGTQEYKIIARIARKKSGIFVREDFEDIAGYDQVGRVLKNLAKSGRLIRLGYGVYAKTKKSSFTDELIPTSPLPALAKEALVRLGVETTPSSFEKAYNAGKSTQVPTGRLIGVRGRVSRKLGYKGAYVNYERAT